MTSRLILHVGRWWAVYRIDPVLIPRPWLHRAVRGELFSFSAWNAVRQGGELLVNKIFEPILSLVAGLPAVGAFYVGRRLGSMPAELIVPMAGVLFPLSSELEAAGRGQTLRRTFLTATKVSLVVALPLGDVLQLADLLARASPPFAFSTAPQRTLPPSLSRPTSTSTATTTAVRGGSDKQAPAPPPRDRAGALPA